MGAMNRQSPVRFPSRAEKSATRNHWTVVLEYDDEGAGPWLVDLCHKTRWDLQDGRLDDLRPCGLPVPPVPGECRVEGRVLVNRMNRTQAAVWHLGNGETPELPADNGYTDVSEATVSLALFGPKVRFITEKLTALDFMAPSLQPPFLLQGPFSHVPCQIVTLERGPDGAGMLLLSASRGYAQDMVHAILEAGKEFGLRPAGESAFGRYLEAVVAP